ncbi:MAG: NAD(P)-dependent oxidoreductase [Litorilinea sp.]
MRILITGISGRIGANVAYRLGQAGHDIRGLVWARDRRKEKLEQLQVELIEGDLVNPADVARAVEGVDAICHLGAAFQGGGPFTHEEYFEINVRGTFNILEAAKARGEGLRQFFFASSDALYDKYIPGGLSEPIREDSFPIQPGGMYALSKQLGENLCVGYWRNFGLPLTVFRFALTVAGDEILHFPQFYLRHWAGALERSRHPQAPAALAEAQAALEKHGQDCLVIARDENGRTFKKHIADVRDIVAGFEAALDKPAAVGQIFQLAAPAPYTWEDAVPYLAERLNLPYVDLRLPGVTTPFYEFDLSKGRELIGYAPSVDIRTQIDDGVAFARGDAAHVLPVI